MKELTFEDLIASHQIRSGTHYIILLDVDGTLVIDNHHTISKETEKAIQQLTQHHTVFLCTNSRNKQRNEKISQQIQLPIANTQYKKPDKRILNELPIEMRTTSILVIGDKFLTDGIFAMRIHAHFIKVKRKTGKERILIQLINSIDDIIYTIAKRWVTSI